jgi:hypothetical protein
MEMDGLHQNPGALNIMYKITFSYMYEVKHKWISGLGLGFILKIFHYTYANIPKSEKQSLIWRHFLSQTFQIRNIQPIIKMKGRNIKQVMLTEGY